MDNNDKLSVGDFLKEWKTITVILEKKDFI